MMKSRREAPIVRRWLHIAIPRGLSGETSGDEEVNRSCGHDQRGGRSTESILRNSARTASCPPPPHTCNSLVRPSSSFTPRMAQLQGANTGCELSMAGTRSTRRAVRRRSLEAYARPFDMSSSTQALTQSHTIIIPFPDDRHADRNLHGGILSDIIFESASTENVDDVRNLGEGEFCR